MLCQEHQTPLGSFACESAAVAPLVQAHVSLLRYMQLIIGLTLEAVEDAGPDCQHSVAARSNLQPRSLAKSVVATQGRAPGSELCLWWVVQSQHGLWA